MKRVKSRKNLSWQTARRKTLNRLFSKPIGPYNPTKWKIATDVFGRAIDVLDLSQDWMSPDVRPESIINAIRQMVDIMDKLGCNDLEDTVHRYMEML